jgi:hypothetical protein
MAARNREFNQELEVLKTMQEDRISINASMTCNEQCVKAQFTATLLPWESSCMSRCLNKHAQAGLIVNYNIEKIQALEKARVSAKQGNKRY